MLVILAEASTVGSAVYFDSEGFIKSNYRKYNIKNSKKSDDYGCTKRNDKT
jgi:excinuclease UvrABC nuclease subunit